MKDNYKAEWLRIYTEGRNKEVLERLKDLGYEDLTTLQVFLECKFIFTDENGALSYDEDDNDEFIENPAKHITVDELLAPQKGEMFEFRDSDYEDWEQFEFFCDLGEYAPHGNRYIDSYGNHWKQMRPIVEIPQKKGFDEAISHLEEAIKLLKG